MNPRIFKIEIRLSLLFLLFIFSIYFGGFSCMGGGSSAPAGNIAAPPGPAISTTPVPTGDAAAPGTIGPPADTSTPWTGDDKIPSRAYRLRYGSKPGDVNDPSYPPTPLQKPDDGALNLGFMAEYKWEGDEWKSIDKGSFIRVIINRSEASPSYKYLDFTIDGVLHYLPSSSFWGNVLFKKRIPVETGDSLLIYWYERPEKPVGYNEEDVSSFADEKTYKDFVNDRAALYLGGFRIIGNMEYKASPDFAAPRVDDLSVTK